MIDKIIGADEHGENDQGQDLTKPVYIRARDDLSSVLASYDVITS